MFAARPAEAGDLEVQIIGRWSRYPDAGVEVRRDFSIIVEACQLARLTLIDDKPFGDMIQMLGQPAKTYPFDLDEIAVIEPEGDCGPLEISFSIFQPGVETSREKFFTYTDSGFTLSQYPFNKYELMGHY